MTNSIFKPLTITAAFVLPFLPVQAQTLLDPTLSVTQVASGLTMPVGIEFLGTNDFLVLEKNNGQVLRVLNGVVQPAPALDVSVDNAGGRGLLSIAKHPGFATNHLVYLCYTDNGLDHDTTGEDPLCICIYQYQWNGSVLTNANQIFSFQIQPGIDFDNGGAMVFGPDDKLYIVTGDHGESNVLQNVGSGLADDTSVIVRLNDDGSPPTNNPFYAQGSNYRRYYAYGIHNSFGLAFDPVNGNLWDTEDGGANYDEINLVLPGFNSGWLQISGPAARNPSGTNDLFVIPGSHYADPAFSWFTSVGPTGIAFVDSTALGAQYENDLFVGDSLNGLLYHFKLDEARTGLVLPATFTNDVANTVKDRNQVVIGTGFGTSTGIGALKIGPDGRLYIVSSGLGKIFAISGNANTNQFHDLAVVSVSAPKKIGLSTTKPSLTKPLKISITNLGTLTETIDDEATLTNLVNITIDSFGACPVPAPVLVPPKTGFPIVLAPKKKLSLSYNVTFNCANDPAAGTGHEDFQYTVTLNHQALGTPDNVPANDTCPRPPNPATGDKGCNKGLDIFTDVVEK